MERRHPRRTSRPLRITALALLTVACVHGVGPDENGKPTILALTPSTVNQGIGDFTLTVGGYGFVASSVVRWNGDDRPTTFVSATQLTAEIAAADVAEFGAAAITVFNPAPGGGESETIALTIAPTTHPEPTLASIEPASLEAGGGEAMLTLTGTGTGTGAITDTVFVGSRPDGLAVSGDEAVLWVALDGTDEVRRIDLASLTSDLAFSLDGNRVDHMRVMPGSPGTLAIALRNAGGSPRHQGVAIYDDGEPRPLRTPGHTGSNSIIFGGDPSVPYGLNDETTEYGFRTMAAGPDGVEATNTTEGPVGTSYRRSEYGAGRVYVTDSAISDPEHRKLVGTFPGDGRAVRPDPELGRAYFIDESGTVAAYDVNDSRLPGSLDAGAVAFGHPATSRLRLVRWGADGLALHDVARIYILRTTIASP